MSYFTSFVDNLLAGPRQAAKQVQAAQAVQQPKLDTATQQTLKPRSFLDKALDFVSPALAPLQEGINKAVRNPIGFAGDVVNQVKYNVTHPKFFGADLGQDEITKKYPKGFYVNDKSIPKADKDAYLGALAKDASKAGISLLGVVNAPEEAANLLATEGKGVFGGIKKLFGAFDKKPELQEVESIPGRPNILVPKGQAMKFVKPDEMVPLPPELTETPGVTRSHMTPEQIDQHLEDLGVTHNPIGAVEAHFAQSSNPFEQNVAKELHKINTESEGIDKFTSSLKDKDYYFHGSSHTDLKELRAGKGGDDVFGPGVYLTKSPDTAKMYAAGWAGGVDPNEFAQITNKNIYAVKLKPGAKVYRDELYSPESAAMAKEKGFDAYESQGETVVFDPKNVEIVNKSNLDDLYRQTTNEGVTDPFIEDLERNRAKEQIQEISDNLKALDDPYMRQVGAELDRIKTKIDTEQRPQLGIEPQSSSEYLGTAGRRNLRLGTNPEQIEQLKGPNQLEQVKSSNDIIAPPDKGNVTLSDINGLGDKLTPSKKVGLLDYLTSTPDRVLKKIGLGKEAELLKEADLKYKLNLPKELERISNWAERVKKFPDASRRIFKFLNGEKIALNPEESAVAHEIRDYLKKWADALGLPEDRRFDHYITHIFEKGIIQKEFDPELAKIIADRVPGSVYDPFLQERLGKRGYIEDTFRALDAYVKRAVRKVYMDPALEKVAAKAEELDVQSYNYVKNYTARINLRPTEIDNLLDNLIKDSPIGYRLGARPVTAISSGIRNTIYRGTLGLNVGSALKNLTQGINTYAILGEKYTGIGYLKALKSLLTNSKELEEIGVLSNNIIDSREVSAIKKGLQQVDGGLWAFFNLAEKINRGAAYFGAKSKALAQGLSEGEAIKAGFETARKTQFTFGAVDTPVALQSDLVKLATQFLSYPVKQSEFLVEMLGDKQFASAIRFMAANFVVISTVGNALGLDWKSVFVWPQAKFASSPFFGALDAGKDYFFGSGKDKAEAPKKLENAAVSFIPAGVQGKKTIVGLGDYFKGKSTTPTGRTRYTIPQDFPNFLKAGLLGTYKTDNAQSYIDKITGKSKPSTRSSGRGDRP